MARKKNLGKRKARWGQLPLSVHNRDFTPKVKPQNPRRTAAAPTTAVITDGPPARPPLRNRGYMQRVTGANVWISEGSPIPAYAH